MEVIPPHIYQKTMTRKFFALLVGALIGWSYAMQVSRYANIKYVDIKESYDNPHYVINDTIIENHRSLFDNTDTIIVVWDGKNEDEVKAVLNIIKSKAPYTDVPQRWTSYYNNISNEAHFKIYEVLRSIRWYYIEGHKP